jgi:hypothetical protein
MPPPYDRQRFLLKWFEGSLPEDLPKGYTFIMDNLMFNRKKELRRLPRGESKRVSGYSVVFFFDTIVLYQ